MCVKEDNRFLYRIVNTQCVLARLCFCPWPMYLNLALTGSDSMRIQKLREGFWPRTFDFGEPKASKYQQRMHVSSP